MYEYAITVHDDENGPWASCRDIPEFHSAGYDLAHLLQEAVDGMICALSIYVDQDREIPAATQARAGEHVLPLPPLEQAKLSLWSATCERGWSRAELARALDTQPEEVNRLLDPLHPSKMDHVESALLALATE